MDWLIKTLTDCFALIRFSRVMNKDDLNFRQWCIENVEIKPDMDYKNLTFELVINFGNDKTYKELYTPDFIRNLESKLAPISEKIEDTNKYILRKQMTITIKRGTR